ncbi:MAG TPA: sugar ABC transporter permease [Candidatus Limnocylindrales bacterium]|nr:sugar ABC transporter permease [Candidatus Limnocylindrales bacterium]
MAGRGSPLRNLLYVVPALLLLAVFIVYPVIRTIQNSFTTGRGLQEKFVGLDNYVTLLTADPLFLDLSFPPSGAVFNNVLWVFLYTGLCIALGMTIAVLADRVRYESLVKSIVFLPMAISATAIGVIWLLVYSPDPTIGLVNAVVGTVGITPIALLGRPDTVNFAIIIAAVWAGAGFAMVIFSAAIKSIPAEIMEAARVDGATERQIFRRITLPMISLPVAVVAVTLVINVIKVFDIIYVMTAGGPGGASRVIAYTFFRETFESSKPGYGSAVAVLMLLLIIPIMAFNIRRFRTTAVVR